jgi:predicted transcriptional regulator
MRARPCQILDELLWFTNNQSEPMKEFVMTAFTVRVPEDIANKLDQLAQRLDRSRSYMAAQAIEDFVAREEWQLAEIEAGLAEADVGDFASDAELAAVVSKYVKPARQL